MEVIDLFAIPLYRFKFQEHDTYKEKMMSYLKNPEVYKDNTRSGRDLCFTKPILHQLPEFKEFSEFVHLSLQLAMRNMGFVPRLQITGLWGTMQKKDGWHHSHQHANSFLSGVYYLHGNDEHSGTIFSNVHRNHKQIIPEQIEGEKLKILDKVRTRFEEGTLYIFPSWLVHETGVNSIKKDSVNGNRRYIISFNCMPIGQSKHDVLENFDYQDMSKSTEKIITTKYEVKQGIHIDVI